MSLVNIAGLMDELAAIVNLKPSVVAGACIVASAYIYRKFRTAFHIQKAVSVALIVQLYCT